MSDFDIASFRDRLPRSSTKATVIQLHDDDSDADSSDSEDFNRRQRTRKDLGNFTTSQWDDGSESEGDTTPKRAEASAEASQAAQSQQEEASFSAEAAPIQQIATTTVLDDLDDEDDACIILSDDNNEVVEQTIRSHPSSSPERPTPPKRPRLVVPSVQEIEDLDPELASIKPSTASSSQQKVIIKVCYMTQRIPSDDRLLALINRLKKPLSVYVMENDPFDKLLTSYAQHKRLRKDDLQLVYKDVPVVLRATPASLDMVPESQGKNMMQVYVKSDYEKIAQEELQRAEEIEKMFGNPIDDDLFAADNPTTSTPVEEEEEEERLHLKLRGRDNQDLLVRVKKTTTMAAIAKEYCKRKELAEDVAATVQLSFEGETLSADDCVGDTELEDQDIVSVMIRS